MFFDKFLVIKYADKNIALQSNGTSNKNYINIITDTKSGFVNIMHFTTKRTVSLHNFFVFFPLEILILNKDKQVIEINKKFWPFTFFTSKNKGMYCIELATNDSKNQCKVRDFVEFDILR